MSIIHRKGFFWVWVVVIAIIVVYLIVQWLIPAIWPQYAAVYTTTGDIYFGRLSVFPQVALHEAWYLQRDSSGNVGIAPFSRVTWEPRGDMRFNSSQVVWVAPLQKGSQLYTALVTGGVLPNTNGTPVLSPTPSPVPTQ